MYSPPSPIAFCTISVSLCHDESNGIMTYLQRYRNLSSNEPGDPSETAVCRDRRRGATRIRVDNVGKRARIDPTEQSMLFLAPKCSKRDESLTYIAANPEKKSTTTGPATFTCFSHIHA